MFKPFLDKFVIVFIDDIFVYSRSKNEHAEHLRVVSETLRENRLYAKLSICELWFDSMTFLGHVVCGHGNCIDPKKIKVAEKWARPKVAVEIRSFLGLASYYTRLVRDFPKIFAQLARLIKKEVKFGRLQIVRRVLRDFRLV